MANLNEVLDYYASLLIIQYRIKQKAKDTMRLAANQSVCDGLVFDELNAFDLDTAFGAQLTIIGRIVGVERKIFGLDLTKDFFSFTRAATLPSSIGFGRTTDDPYTGFFLRAQQDAIYFLDDFELSALIKLKIIFNNTYSSFKNIKEALYAYFAGDIDIINPELTPDTTDQYFNFTRANGTPASIGFGRTTDSPYTDLFFRASNYQIMDIRYRVKNKYITAFNAGILLGIIPKPMAVSLTVDYVE